MRGARQRKTLLALVGIALAFALVGQALAAKPGQLDRSFGKDGKASGSFCDHERDFAVALDDHRHQRLVVAGTQGFESGFCLARYLPNGKLDRSFSGNGWVVTQFPGGEEGADSLAIDRHGRIVAAGAYGTSRIHQNKFALARYNPDGTLDSSFGNGGLVTETFGNGGARSVAIDNHNRIVAVGGTQGAGFGVARFKANGDPDASFGTGGTVTTPTCCTVPYSVGIDPERRIVVGGYDDTLNGSNFNFAVARYLPSGDADNSFSGDGQVTADRSNFDIGRSVAIDRHERVLLGGTQGSQDGPRRFAVLRYRTDGTLDSSFGDHGVATTRFKDGQGANSIGIDSKGRIVATGGGFDVARFRNNGNLDQSFSKNGKSSPNWLAIANSLAIDRKDRIDVVGWHSHLLLARFFG